MSTLAELMVKIGVDADDIEKMGSKLGPVAKAAGVAIGGAMVAGAIIGMERNAVSDKMAAQLRLSEEQSRTAGDIAGRLYADAYGDSFAGITETVGQVIGTFEDLTTEAVERVAAKAADLEAAFDISDAVARASTLVESGLAKDVDHAMDLITASMQEVAPGLRDEIGEATTEYAKFFADLGFSGEEALGLLASADDRFALDKTGDAIKELSIRATDMSTVSVEAFEAAGLNADDMAAKILAGGDTAREGFDQIVEGLLGIEDPTARANAAIGLFGTPLEDLGTAGIPGFLESLQALGGGIQDVTGRAEEMGDTLNDNAKTKIEGVKRSVEGFLARIVEAPGLLGDMASGAAGAGAALQPIAPMMTGLAVVFQGQIGSMVGAIGTKITALGAWAAATVAQGAKALASMAVTAAQFVAHYARMAAASLVSAAKIALSWIIAMGPIALVIAAVVGLVALIIANWDTVKKWTKAAWEWVSEKIAAVWDWIKTTVSGGVTAVIGFFTNLRDKIKAAVTAARDWVISKFGELVTGAIGKAVELVDWLRGLPARLLSALGNLALLLVDAGKSIVTGLWEGIKSMGKWLADKITGWVADKIPGPIAKALGISSPSKVTAGLGGEVAAGLAMGMSKDLRLVERSAMRLAAASLPEISGLRTPGVSSDPGASPSVPTVSAMSGAPAGRATPPPPIYIGNVYGWDDFVKKVREAGVDINRLGWQ